MTQGSIDKIYKYSGKLAILIEWMADANRIVEQMENEEIQESDAVLSLAIIAERMGDMHTSEMSNDLGDIFKQFYNRTQGA